MSDQPVVNTDREIWRETPDDYYSPSVHVTKDGGIGIKAAGRVVVKSARAWVEMAWPAALPLVASAAPPEKCGKQLNTGTGSTNCQLHADHGGYCSEHAIAMAARQEEKEAREGLAWLQYLATDAGGAKAPVAQIHKKRLRAIVDALGVALAARPAAAPQEDKTDDLGLSIDMLDVDRLREWARLLLVHGADISHWGSVTYVAGKMQLIATGIERAIKDIGTLRLAARPVSLVAPTFSENDIKDVLTALYQDGHVDLVLADRVAALMKQPPPAAPPVLAAPPQDDPPGIDQLCEALADAQLPVCALHVDAEFVCPDCFKEWLAAPPPREDELERLDVLACQWAFESLSECDVMASDGGQAPASERAAIELARGVRKLLARLAAPSSQEPT